MTTTGLGAALLVGLAAALLVGPTVASGPVRRDGAAGRSGRPAVLAVAAAGAALALLLDGTRLALALIGAGVGLAVTRAAGRARRRRRERAVRASVVELAEAMVAELRSGQPVVTTLEQAADLWPPFRSVAAAARLGADVPGAMRRLAAQPGAEGLREVASAWRVSERSGAALSSALEQVAASARARHAAEHLVQAELSSARATARLVAVLPAVTLALAAGAGAEPWAFLLSHPAGLACLATGAALVLAGLAWIDRIASGVHP